MTTLSSSENLAPHAADAQAGTAGTKENPKGQLRPLFIVMNAGSGKDDAAAVREALAKQLSDAGQPYELLLCRKSDNLSRLVEKAVSEAARSNGIVVAAGGDGTIRTVAQQVITTGLPFGVLPQGTFNYFARDNQLPEDPATAVAALIAGAQAGCERLVYAGQLNDQLFLVNASLGLYPQLLEDREQLFKRRSGRSRLMAIWSGLLTLLRRDTTMTLRMECTDLQRNHTADVMRACTLFVGNNALQLDQVGLTEKENVPAEQLTVLVLPPMHALQRLGIALRSMLGRLGSAPNKAHFHCQHLTVEPLLRGQPRLVKVAVDGEYTRMRPPLVFRVAPRPLRLVVPPPGWSPA